MSRFDAVANQNFTKQSKQYAKAKAKYEVELVYLEEEKKKKNTKQSKAKAGELGLVKVIISTTLCGVLLTSGVQSYPQKAWWGYVQPIRSHTYLISSFWPSIVQLGWNKKAARPAGHPFGVET